MIVLPPDSLEFSDSYVEGDDAARWRSASGHSPSTGAGASGSSVLELPAGGIAVVPEDIPHEVRNAGERTLRFVAVYAAPVVITRYEQEVQPDGSRERRTVG